MMDYLWAAMIMIGIIVAAFLGNLDAISEGIIVSAKEAIELLFVMLGVISMWNGLLKIAEESGLVKKLKILFRPLIRFAFPHLPYEHEATAYICENFIANMLGLSWACTPAGIKAMKALQALEKKRGRQENVVSDEMATFLILNISSLQLIPINMIAYRSQYGSAHPTAIVGISLIATICNTLFALMLCKLFCGKFSKRCEAFFEKKVTRRGRKV